MSTPDTALATRAAQAPALTAYEPRDLDQAARLAGMLHASGLAPRSLARPEAILYCLIAGRELGLSATQALRSLHIIDGKVVMSADLIAAQAKRSPACRYWHLVESTAERCVIETQRDGDPAPTRLTYTIEDARAAGLTGKDNWRRHPAAMLRARCSTALARAVYPDTALGLYDTDEGEEIAKDTIRARVAEVHPAPTIEAQVEPADPSAPQGSRAWAGYVEAMPRTRTPSEVRALYTMLGQDLHEEGEDPRSYLEDSPEGPGAATLAARRLAGMGLALTATAVTAILGAASAVALQLLDALLGVARSPEDVARWWVSVRERAAGDQSARDLVYYTAARWSAGLEAPDAQRTKAAKTALDRAVAALDPQPPKGGKRPETPPASSPEPTPAPVEAPAPTLAAVPAPADWAGSREGMEAHAATLPVPQAVLASARKHHDLVGYGPVLIARLLACTPPDEHGTTLSRETAAAQIARAQREGRERAQRQPQRRAA